jgi:hypothetical protein
MEWKWTVIGMHPRCEPWPQNGIMFTIKAQRKTGEWTWRSVRVPVEELEAIIGAYAESRGIAWSYDLLQMLGWPMQGFSSLSPHVWEETYGDARDKRDAAKGNGGANGGHTQ